MKPMTSYELDQKEWLKNPTKATAYLDAVLEEGDKATLLLALREVAQAYGGKAAGTETIQLVGPPEVINRLRKYAMKVGAGVIESTESIPAVELSPELVTNPAGVYLRGIRIREDLTQDALAQMTGISRSNISAMEHGKRSIGKETAKRLAAVLKCDYRLFL